MELEVGGAKAPGVAPQGPEVEPGSRVSTRRAPLRARRDRAGAPGGRTTRKQDQDLIGRGLQAQGFP